MALSTASVGGGGGRSGSGSVFFVSVAMLTHVPRIAAIDLAHNMAEDEVNTFLVGTLSEQLQNPMENHTERHNRYT